MLIKKITYKKKHY